MRHVTVDAQTSHGGDADPRLSPLWTAWEADFNGDLERVKKANAFFLSNLKEIFDDAVLGQCERGHSCAAATATAKAAAVECCSCARVRQRWRRAR